MTFDGQLALELVAQPDDKPRKPTIAERFAAHLLARPEVYAMFEARALELAAAGARRLSGKAIAEWMRPQLAKMGDEYACNNTNISGYCRRVIERHPGVGTLFEFRTRGADR